MPQECKEFDCREHKWVVIREWQGEWVDTEMYEVEKGYKPVGIATVKEEE